MRVARDRLVIDTNLWISYLLGMDFGTLGKSIQSRLVVLLFSEELFEEFLAVALRPKFSRYFSLDDLEQLSSFLRHFSELITVRTRVILCRDPKDNFLLALVVDGRASHLLTGDRDLLLIGTLGPAKILRIKEYLKSA